MIYLVTRKQELFDNPEYEIIDKEKSLEIIKDWDFIQYDSETTGRDPHLCQLLCMQFGDPKGEIQVVVDTTTISPLAYKEVLENKLLIGQNIKFDLEFLYNYSIVPRKVYDTMIVEQLLYLGYPRGVILFGLGEIAYRRLGINIDKSIRGQIIWRGLDTEVIKYAANDVKYLAEIMWKQVAECKEKHCLVGAKLECDAVPSIAYLEWCGIHLDQDRWKAKMASDKENYNKAKAELDKFAISNPLLSKYTYVDKQYNLFEGWDLEPKCTVNWSSSRQVVEVAKILGFDTQVKDKKTGEDKDSVLEKHLKTQKGINDEFLKLYFDYQEYAKVITSFGQGHLNAINPKTGRIHTVFRQLGTDSGRLSCGSNQANTDLAKFKGLSPKECTYPNLQQLPSDEKTRSSFTAPKGHLFVSADFSAEELTNCYCTLIFTKTIVFIDYSAYICILF